MSTDRQQPDPIHDELVARIDDWVENALDPQACAAALRTVLAIAKAAEDGALRWQDQLPVPEWVVDVRQGIANALRLTATEPAPTGLAVGIGDFVSTADEPVVFGEVVAFITGGRARVQWPNGTEDIRVEQLIVAKRGEVSA